MSSHESDNEIQLSVPVGLAAQVNRALKRAGLTSLAETIEEAHLKAKPEDFQIVANFPPEAGDIFGRLEERQSKLDEELMRHPERAEKIGMHMAFAHSAAVIPTPGIRFTTKLKTPRRKEPLPKGGDYAFLESNLPNRDRTA